MSMTFGMKKATLKAFGHRVDVPNNAFAKLMYYLNCVAVVVDIEENILTDYENYDKLSGHQLTLVYDLAKQLNPSVFFKNKIFIRDQSLLLNLDNQFYELKDEIIGFHVNEEIMIGGKLVKVKKIMACNDTWLSTYYFRPIQEIDSKIRNQTTNTNTNNNDIYISTLDQPALPDLGSSPVNITCTHCSKSITTVTKSKFDFVACAFCMLFNWLYCCVQICRKKNVCCYDISHICPRCGETLGEHNAC